MIFKKGYFVAKKRLFLIIFLILGFFGVLIRNSWISDDAYITFRTVDNFLNGYGLRWNILERVQTYTHPLWMFLVVIVEFFTRDIFFTSHFLSILVSVLTVSIFAFILAPSLSGALIGLVALTLSNAFMEYSSSGLENPLTHLLIVLFMWVYTKRSGNKLFYLSLLASLAMLNRMDTILLFAPFLAVSFMEKPSWKKFQTILLGFVPFFVWECFSLVYYGFLFPNTAYAKLATGIWGLDLARQGMHYFSASFQKDPLTLSLIFGTLFISVYLRKRYFLPFVIGLVLYMMYIIKIGGCFMNGRFFSAPFLMATIAFVSLIDRYLRSKKIFWSVLSIILLLGFSSRTNPILKTKNYGIGKKYSKRAINNHGIADEQMFYFQSTGLLCRKKDGTPPYKLNFIKRDLKQVGLDLKKQAPSLSLQMVIGVTGYFSGPETHIIDILALSDPLLARRPIKDRNNWRIGHFKRAIPDGYLESIQTGRNMIKDKKTAVLYKKIKIVTQGSLFSFERIKAILYLNFGCFL